MNKEEAAKELLRRKKARTSLLHFMEYVWWRKEPFKKAEHIVDICSKIDIAIEKFLNNESSYLDLSVVFGHGKSQISSIALPAYFLGRCFLKDPSIIMTGYGAALINGFSKSVKNIIKSNEYKALFPNIILKRGDDSVQEWGLENSQGKITATGMGGAITGKRAHLVIIDDYCKSVEEARSEIFREKTWNSFKNDLMTRLMPVHLVLIVATPWHVQDLKGKIKLQERKDPDFPKFLHIKYPAKKSISDDGTIEYLWEDLYPKSWYVSQYALNGKFANGLMDCEPVPDGGMRFNCDHIDWLDSVNECPQGRYIRAWDLASSSKERNKSDPDFTCGVLGTVTIGTNGVRQLWIKNIVLGQWEAPERDKKIIQTCQNDGVIPIYVEAFAAYKDAYTTLKHILMGKRSVNVSRMSGDKSSKAAPLEPIFEACNVHIVKGSWKDEFIRQFTSFPNGQFDDIVDAVSIVYDATAKRNGGVLVY